MIFAIDPGPGKSAFVGMDETLRPVTFGIRDNEELLEGLVMGDFDQYTYLAIEMVASYGMPVGKDVFETCVWIGRFWQASKQPIKQFVYRKDAKMNICGSMRAKDSNIRQALIDRFGVVGTKKQPGWFYGFKADIWSAYAVGVTFHDINMSKTLRGVASG